MFWAVLGVAMALQQAPVPRPFPQPSSPQGPSSSGAPPQQPQQPRPQPAPPASPTPGAQPPARQMPARAADGSEAPPTEVQLGVPIYPAAQFIRSYDAGRGQRFYIFGSTAPYLDLVQYYRTALKQKGEEVFDVPATWEFDVGKYREDSMAFPPGVTIKDFQSDVSQGYPNPVPGGQPARFPTIIQIVPVPPQN